MITNRDFYCLLVSIFTSLSCAISQSCAQIDNHELVIAVESSSSNAYFTEVSNKVNDVIDNNNSSVPDFEVNTDSEINMNMLMHMETTFSTSPNTINVLDNYNRQIDIEEPNIILSELRAKNSERFIVAQININAVESKFQSLVSLV